MIKAYRKSTIFAETFLTYITHLNAFGADDSLAQQRMRGSRMRAGRNLFNTHTRTQYTHNNTNTLMHHTIIAFRNLESFLLFLSLLLVSACVCVCTCGRGWMLAHKDAFVVLLCNLKAAAVAQQLQQHHVTRFWQRTTTTTDYYTPRDCVLAATALGEWAVG